MTETAHPGATAEGCSLHFDRMIVLDFETTGLEPGYRPVEIAWIEFDASFNVIEDVHSLINPRIPIEPGAERTHGITASMVADKPTLDEFLGVAHSEKFRNEHVLAVAHNARYDVPMFAPFCARITPLCTMRLSHALHPSAPNHRLGTIVEMLGIEVEPNHRALADAGACFAILRDVAARHAMTIPDLIAASNDFTLDSVIPFGKHKGTKLRDLPEDYIRWCIEKLDEDNWVRVVLASR